MPQYHDEDNSRKNKGKPREWRNARNNKRQQPN